MEPKSVLRGLLILACMASGMIASILRQPRQVRAVGPNYWYNVVIVAEMGSPDEDCYVPGSGCSSTSCDHARTVATADALANMPSRCVNAPYHYAFESCDQDSNCSP